MAATVAPAFEIDAMVAEAAAKAFGDLAAAFHAGRQPDRARLLEAVDKLGFADAMPSPDGREAWSAAAAIIRAQARAAAPIDMALLLSTGDRTACIDFAPDASPGVPGSDRKEPSSREARAALALGRVLQIGAAMEAALELSLRYAQDRRQFGQPLAKFQAIQHGLAIAAEEIAACEAAAELALACAAREGIAGGRLAALLDAAALVAARAVDVVYDVCHQVHGAIGFTREYALHRHSLDLLRWRAELLRLRGGELRAAERLGDAALQSGGLWRAVTDAMTPGGTDG